MKESIKMEDYDGFQWNFIKEEKTKILPLRWFANLCEIPAHYHLDRFLRCDDLKIRGFVYRYHGYMSNLFYKPYFKWGTVYRLDMDAIKDAWAKDPNHEELMQRLKDYNENGIPYWEEFDKPE